MNEMPVFVRPVFRSDASLLCEFVGGDAEDRAACAADELRARGVPCLIWRGPPEAGGELIRRSGNGA